MKILGECKLKTYLIDCRIAQLIYVIAHVSAMCPILAGNDRILGRHCMAAFIGALLGYYHYLQNYHHGKEYPFFVLLFVLLFLSFVNCFRAEFRWKVRAQYLFR